MLHELEFAIKLVLYAGLGGSAGCPTGHQEVACRVGNILLWRFAHEIFSTVIFSPPLIQEGSCLAKECAQYSLTA